MLAGSFNWIAPPPREVRPISPEKTADFTPAPKSFHYRKPPKAKSQPKQPKIVIQEADAPHMGHAAQIVNKQIRRPETSRLRTCQAKAKKYERSTLRGSNSSVASVVEEELGCTLRLLGTTDRLECRDNTEIVSEFTAAERRNGSIAERLTRCDRTVF
jgi:hypothetical protein